MPISPGNPGSFFKQANPGKNPFQSKDMHLKKFKDMFKYLNVYMLLHRNMC